MSKPVTADFGDSQITFTGTIKDKPVAVGESNRNVLSNFFGRALSVAHSIFAGKLLSGQTANPIDIQDSEDGTVYKVDVNGRPIVKVQAVTAAGTNQSGATLASGGINLVTSSDANAGVRVPASSPIGTQMVFAVNANGVRVYPASGESIANAVVNTPVVLAANKTCVLIKVSSTNWAILIDTA